MGERKRVSRKHIGDLKEYFFYNFKEIREQIDLAIIRSL